MDPVIAAPAGAAAAADTGAGAEVETVSATVAAADAGDVSAFLEADRSAREGKPAPKVERPKTVEAAKPGAVAGKGGQPAKGPKPADVAADERIRRIADEAVKTATKVLSDENLELRRRLDGTVKPAPGAGTDGAAAPGADDAKAKADAAKAEYKRYLAMPNAPKIEEFDSVAEHNAALSVFINDTRHAERTEANRAADRYLEQETKSIDRVKGFHGRIEKYKETDPTFATKLTPEVRGLHGVGKLLQINEQRKAAGQPALDATVDHFIAEQMYDSEGPAQIAVFLSEHPEELATLRAAQNPTDLAIRFDRLVRRVMPEPADDGADDGAEADTNETPATIRAKADDVVDRSVSKVKPPTPTLGKAGSKKDPIREAISTGDVGMFLELDRQQRAEKAGLTRR